jgi:hypothetical protein
VADGEEVGLANVGSDEDVGGEMDWHRQKFKKVQKICIRDHGDMQMRVNSSMIGLNKRETSTWKRSKA